MNFGIVCDHVARFRDNRVNITGDFNLSNIDWNHPYSNSATRDHVDYVAHIMLNGDVHQIVNQPTRIQNNTVSLLDLVFISSSLENYNIS